MEHLDYSKIIEKIGPEKDLSKLTEEELWYYDLVRAVKSRSADDEKERIRNAIRQAKNEQFKIHTNQNRINMKTSNKTWIGIAAGFAILVVAYFLLWNKGKSNEDIFFESFKTHTDYLNVAKDKAQQYGMAGTGTETRDSFLMAIEFFENNKYDEAIKILVPFVDNHPENVDARYMLSKAQVNREKYTAAMVHLTSLNNNNAIEPVLQDQVKWDLALCYLQMVDGRKQAKFLFEELVKLGGLHAVPAKANLEYMK